MTKKTKKTRTQAKTRQVEEFVQVEAPSVIDDKRSYETLARPIKDLPKSEWDQVLKDNGWRYQHESYSDACKEAREMSRTGGVEDAYIITVIVKRRQTERWVNDNRTHQHGLPVMWKTKKQKKEEDR